MRNQQQCSQTGSRRRVRIRRLRCDFLPTHAPAQPYFPIVGQLKTHLWPAAPSTTSRRPANSLSQRARTVARCASAPNRTAGDHDLCPLSRTARPPASASSTERSLRSPYESGGATSGASWRCARTTRRSPAPQTPMNHHRPDSLRPYRHQKNRRANKSAYPNFTQDA